VTIVAVVGDVATTSTVALAAAWPTHDEVTVLEADPAGGSLAGWLDTPAHPSLATIVANVGQVAGDDHRPVLDTFHTMSHRSAPGIRFVSNAVRARAAHRAIEEAAIVVLPAIAAAPITVIADVGAFRSGQSPSPALRVADVVVVVHQQAAASAAAASVRIERLVEMVEELAHLDTPIILAVVGSTPFEPAEIGAFVDESVPDTVRMTVAIADDPLAAAAIAGRTGVSSKRLRRLPLMRDAARLADAVCELLDEQHSVGAVGSMIDGRST